MSISTSTNHCNQPYGYADILSHLATSISKRHYELSEQCLQFKLKSEGHLEKFVFMLEEISEMGTANAFDIQDLNNIITLIENTSSDQLPYCAHRIQYFAQKVLNSITLSQPPPIIPFIPDLWNIISNYAFASYEMPYVAKTLQGWGWNELAGPIPTATVWDVVFQYLGFERATVPLSAYESMLKLGDDEILTDYVNIYHAAIDPIYRQGIAEISDNCLRFDNDEHARAFNKLTHLNYSLQDSNDACEKYWLERRTLSIRMPSSFTSFLHFRSFSNEEDFGATFFGPILYREIVEYNGANLNDSSIFTLSPFLRNLVLTNYLNNIPIEKLLTHYIFLQSFNLRNYPFNKVQIIDNQCLKKICFRNSSTPNALLKKQIFQLYVKNPTRLTEISLTHWSGNFRLDVINSVSLERLILSGLIGANRIKLRNVPLLKQFRLYGDIESLDIEDCPNLKILSISFKNIIQNPKAYFNISSSSITHLKLSSGDLKKRFDFPNALLNVVLKQRKILKLQLENFQNLPEIFLPKLGPQLTSIELSKVHERIWGDLTENCTQLTSQYRSPFQKSNDNTKIWSIIQSYVYTNSDSQIDQDNQPLLFNFFRKYGMFMELFEIFTLQRNCIPIDFAKSDNS